MLRGSLGSCEKYQQLCRVCGVVPRVYVADGNAVLLSQHQGTGVGRSSSARGPAPKCTHYLICTATWKRSSLSLTGEGVPVGLTVSAGWLCPPDSGSPGTRPHGDWQAEVPVAAIQGEEEHWGVWTLCKPFSLSVPPSSLVKQSVSSTSRTGQLWGLRWWYPWSP